MNKVSERYNTKVKIPITVLLETIFSDDNYDVETLSRWALHYGFVDLDKEEKVYRLQKDYEKQDFYIWLSKKERKQYDYENTLLDRIDKAIKEIDYLIGNCNLTDYQGQKIKNILEGKNNDRDRYSNKNDNS